MSIMASAASSHLLLSLTICSLISFVQSGVTIDLIHRDSPLSPAHDPSQTRFQRLRSAIDRSFSRKSLFSPNALIDAPLSAGGGGEYLIEYQIGTPPVRQLGIVDTGSDLTWLQCQPYTKCYKQDIPLFDSAATKTFKPSSCQSNECAYGGSTGCGATDTCQYQLSYDDGTFTGGDLATDTLTLGSTTAIPGFIFGCGRNNSANFKSPATGIFGLGTGVLSLVVQQAETIRARFSYCLTPPDSNVEGKISFGLDAVVAGVPTPLLSKDPDVFLSYSLNLEGISVGEQRFAAPAAVKGGNIIIDSGTTLSFIPPELYEGIEGAVTKAMTATRVKDPQGKLNLCYRSEGSKLSSPSITAHFQGADVLLGEGSTFVQVEKGIVCFTLVPSKDVAVFGNLHQVGYHIGYDMVEKKVSFLKTDCALPRR